MSGTTTPAASGRYSLANVFTALPVTLTGIGIVAAALVPVFQGGMPTNSGGWISLIVAAAVAVERALSKS